VNDGGAGAGVPHFLEGGPMKILKWLLVGVVFCCGGIVLQMVLDDEDRDAILAWIDGEGRADADE
jgi:hypothetical protein